MPSALVEANHGPWYVDIEEHDGWFKVLILADPLDTPPDPDNPQYRYCDTTGSDGKPTGKPWIFERKGKAKRFGEKERKRWIKVEAKKVAEYLAAKK